MKTIMEQITEALKPVKSVKTLKAERGKTNVFYVSKANKAVRIKADNLFKPDAIDAHSFELVGYDRIVEGETLRNALKTSLFGKTEITVEDAAAIRSAAAKFLEFVKELTIVDAPKKEKTPFQKEKAAAQAKIQNVKAGSNKSLTLEQAKAELIDVYLKYGEVYKPKDAKTNL